MRATITSLGIRRQYTFRPDAPIGIPFRQMVDTMTLSELRHCLENTFNALMGREKYAGERRIAPQNRAQTIERLAYINGAIELLAEQGKTAILTQYPDYWTVNVVQYGMVIAQTHACNKSLAVRWIRDHHRDVARLVA